MRGQCSSKRTQPMIRQSRTNPADAAIQRFADMMIETMERMRDESWKKGWLTAIPGGGVPMNISGRPYSGANPFMLQLVSMANGYKAPVFLTFNQANKLDAHVLKGEKSFPVLYWQPLYKDSDGKTVPNDVVDKMTEAEKEKLTVVPLARVNNVFNIDQTNLPEVRPELYNKIVDRFKPRELTRVDGMYVNDDLDRLVAKQAWVCPIKADGMSDSAYYSPSKDYIQVPRKAQFNMDGDALMGGQRYYATMLHEMAHSTGHPSRLNRLDSGHFGDPKYAREELIAEMSSAYVAAVLGFEKEINDNSATYLNAWIGTLKDEPRFILSVLPAVGKASEMIMAHIDTMRIERGAKASTDFDFLPAQEKQEEFKNVSIVRMDGGGYGMRADYGDSHLGIRPVDENTARLYSSLKDPVEKQVFHNEMFPKIYSQELAVAKEASKSHSNGLSM